MIKATVRHDSDVLRVLVDAGSDLHVQNEVRYCGQCSRCHPQLSILGGSDCCNDLSKEWEKLHHWHSSEGKTH